MLALANPWLILGASLAAVAALSGAYVKGRGDGRAIETAERMTIEEVARESREAAIEAAAEQIAKISVVHTTIRQRAETVIREKPVYRDCLNDAAVIRMLDAARENRAPSESARDSELSGTGASPPPDVR